MINQKKELIAISLLVFMTIFPELALAGFKFGASGGDSIAGVFEKILDIMTGKVAKTLAIIAICGSGYLAFAGHLGWRSILNIALGIGIIFGASGIGELLIGG